MKEYFNQTKISFGEMEILQFSLISMFGFGIPLQFR